MDPMVSDYLGELFEALGEGDDSDSIDVESEDVYEAVEVFHLHAVQRRV